MDLPPRSVRTNGNSVRRFRLERGWTQKKLANLAGYSPRLIRKAESCGLLDLETVRNIAEAFSSSGNIVTLQHLTLDLRSIAAEWMDALNRDGAAMVSSIKGLLAEDFVFYCPGDPAVAPFIGTWYGAAGLHTFWELYFSVFNRIPNEDIEYCVGNDLVVARFMESAYVAGQLYGPIRVNMCFTFKDGLIHRIDDDYDTQGGVSTKSESDTAVYSLLEMAKVFVKCFDAGGKGIGETCKPNMTDDIEFHCPADPAYLPFGGTFVGADGVQNFCDRFYGVFTRELNSLTPEYMISPDRIVARFIDQVYFQGHVLPPYWVYLNFQFRDGLICRIDDEFDHYQAKRSFDDLLERLNVSGETNNNENS